MAASKPISWLYLKKTSLFSLNNNFGTFNSCSGLFPFRHTTLSYYVRLCKIHHCPSESKFSPIKSSRFPDVYKTMLLSSFFFFQYFLNYVTKKKNIENNIICPRSQFCTCYDVIKPHTYICFAENQLQQSGLSFTNLPQFFGCLYNDKPFGLLYA